MNIKISHVFGFIAILIALYNAYLSWFKDEFSLTLLILTFVILTFVILIRHYIENTGNNE